MDSSLVQVKTPHIHFVTGKLAAASLRQIVPGISTARGFEYSVEVLNISVAALMTCDWVARHLQQYHSATRIIIPGYCRGRLETIEKVTKIPVERGPRDLRDLPKYFGESPAPPELGQWDIEILAEINHVPRLSVPQVLDIAQRLRTDGADLIDLGCDPGEECGTIGNYVQALREAGIRVSIDSFSPTEVAAAVNAGAELVLSVNRSNREAAADWGCEVVAIPDTPSDLDSLEETIAYLDAQRVPFRADPILEPIGFGFAASLARYAEVRRRYPKVRMLMGIGNLTELTDADSAAANVLLLGICQELGIQSVLTTEVINWARSSVAECHLARQLVYHAVRNRRLPKHVLPDLVLLRAPELREFGDEFFDQLAGEIRDHNVRLFAESGKIHAVMAGFHAADADPGELWTQLREASPKEIDADHAFYLGYEMAKAVTALTLGKEYRQDEALRWGFLTRPEVSWKDRARHKKP